MSKMGSRENREQMRFGLQLAFVLGCLTSVQIGCELPDRLDLDNDGIVDNLDNCPGVANPAQLDTDGDKIGDECDPDSTDQCPDDPNKLHPGSCGCGVSDKDSDGDNAADCQDGCPTDPNKTQPGTCGCHVAEGNCTEPGLIITASDENPDQGEGKEMAFDGDVNTKWLAFAGSAWIQVEFAGGTSKTIRAYSITSADDYPERDPRNWKLLGSNNGTDWTALDERPNDCFAERFETKTYRVDNNTAYQMVRLDISSTKIPNSVNFIQVAEIAFLENSEPGLEPGADGGCAPDRQPNIVVILADDLGHGDASYHQHPDDVHTPNLDTLATDGVQMTNGYANCSVCAPTRASLLTGRYSQRFGFYDANDSRVGLPTDEITIADLLAQKGYSTGVFGKWHCGNEKDKHHPCNRGFDEFYGFLGHGGHDYFDLNHSPDEDFKTPIWNNLQITQNESGYLTDILGDKAVNFVENNKDSPFFLYLPFSAVHTPLQAPEEDIAQFNTGDRNRDIYLAMLYRMDINIGRVLDKLKETGNYENSLIFFFSDNGGVMAHANNMPLEGGKHSFYEGGIRVPFIVSWPDQLIPGKNASPVLGMDIFQTICAVTGIELPNDNKFRDGKDMMPLLRGETQLKFHEYMYWDRDDGDWAIRSGKWKLHKNRQGELTLTDLSKDIKEKTNLINQFPDIVKDLQNKYKAWRNALPPKLKK